MNKTLLYTVLRIVVLFFPAFRAIEMNAQITSPLANAVKTVSYPVDTNKVSVFVFFSPPGSAVHGSLTASLHPDSIYNFDWSKFNTATDSFDISVFGQSGVSQSTVNNLDQGGYRVHITSGSGADTAFIAWVFIDNLKVKVDKDEADKLKQSAFWCYNVNLSGVITVDTFYYYDPITKVPVRLPNGFSFLWTSDNRDLTIYHPSSYLDPQNIDNPPYDDTWFILTAVDSFGMTDIDSVFYESIEVKAQFRFRKYDPLDKEDFVDAASPAEGDAPLRMKFINESENGFNYEWIFSSDSAKSGFFANEFTSDSTYKPEYMYKIPGDYFPVLVVTSEAGCIDSFRFADINPPPIRVVPSKLEVPNVFSPDGNDQNDYFKVKFKSMKEFSLRIYDKAGKMVYKAEVSDMYKWEGWNGNVLDSDRPASPGAYFYVIEATGWDKKIYHKGTYRGVVYLYREGQ